MPRVFMDVTLEIGQTITIGGEDGHHYTRVLRVREGEFLAVASSGCGYLAHIGAVDATAGIVTAHVVETLPTHESMYPVYLIQGLAKGDKIDTIIQHNTELGVAGFLLLETQRSVVKLDSKKRESKLERWRKIAREAASQAQRDVVPIVAYGSAIQAVHDWLDSMSNVSVFFLDEEERTVGLASALPLHSAQVVKRTSVLVVGPEGGWDAVERDVWVNQMRAIPVTLGPRTLRTETAGLVGVSAVLHHYRQLGG